MREIKLRAWDKINNRFIYLTVHPTHIGWASPKYIAQGLLRGADDAVEGVGFAGIEGWQQLTGLKDYNKVDIWEGDILTCGHDSYPIFFDDGSWSVKKGVCFSSNESKHWKISGNICQNSDLIKT